MALRWLERGRGWQRLPTWGTALLGYAIVVGLMFFDLLIANDTRVVGSPAGDLYSQFIDWREFGFGELAQGNLALWNPHIYGGAPFFGGFQAALLYPLNVLYLLLPLPQAINWSVVLHVYLMGAFTYFWVKGRGLSGEASFLAGMLMMMGGAYFPHVYAGHLPNLCTMVWAPLIFLAIDKVMGQPDASDPNKKVGWGYGLLGMFALAMQIFAGHPQYVFITLVAAGLYVAIGMRYVDRRWQKTGWLLIFLGGGLMLSAVQWLTGLQANSESIRSVPIPLSFAGAFSFAPENVITAVAPQFFGNMSGSNPYWGRWVLWEMSLFHGVAGLLTATYGAVYADRRTKFVLLVCILILSVLALGIYTPVFPWLYEYIPGFDKFRGMSKFTFPLSLFAVVLAAHGYDKMVWGKCVEPKFLMLTFAAIGVLALGAIVVMALDWRAVMTEVSMRSHSYFPAFLLDEPKVVAAAQSGARLSLMIGALSTGVMALLMMLLGKFKSVPYLMLALAALEMLANARFYRESFDVSIVKSLPVRKFMAEHPGDYRVLDVRHPNGALSGGYADMWGYDPGLIRRYAEFIAFTQGRDPQKVTQFVTFEKLDPLYQLLRLKYVFKQNGKDIYAVETDKPMQRLHLLSQFQVLQHRDEIFEAMRAPDFDPRREVILEESPFPARPSRVGQPDGFVRLLDSSTDFLDVEATTTQPSILLITDVYSPAWKAIALNGSSQHEYKLLPANYFLRAIPLDAGQHRIRIEYAPWAFTVGKWCSLVAWSLFLMAVLGLMLDRLKPQCLAGEGVEKSTP
jgi:hypothetical protein